MDAFDRRVKAARVLRIRFRDHVPSAQRAPTARTFPHDGAGFAAKMWVRA